MLDEIKGKIKKLGYKMTPQRQTIIDHVLKQAAAVTAAEIWADVRKRNPDISLDTVYRNLSLLVEIDVLIPIAGVGKEGTRYELAHTTHHHHHIVCLECGEAACIQTCPISPQLLSIVKEQGYDLIRHNVELFGVCRKCKADREKS